MPTYEYRCRNCGFEMEELQSIVDPPLAHCPSCNTAGLDRILGGGAGLIFKGTGFYLTDYKKESAGSPATKKVEQKEEKAEEKKEEQKAEVKQEKKKDQGEGKKVEKPPSPGAKE